MSHLGTTRLGHKLDGEDELAVGVANEVYNGHVLRDLLLLGDEVDGQLVLAQSLFHGHEAKAVDKGTSVCT